MSNLTDLEKELSGLENRLRETNEVVTAMLAEKRKFELKVLALKNTISNIRNRTVMRVSDHALLRYAERKYGWDVEALRAEIMTTLSNLPPVGSADMFGFVIKDGTVITYKN